MAQTLVAYGLVGIAALWVAWTLVGRRLVIRHFAMAGSVGDGGGGSERGGWVHRRLAAWARARAGGDCAPRCGGCEACATPRLKVHRRSDGAARSA